MHIVLCMGYMDFKEFTDAIAAGISEYLLQYDIDKVHTEKVCKNNGVAYTGLMITIKGEKLTPNIYLDYYYGLYKEGYGMEKIMSMIGEEYKTARKRLEKDKFITLDELEIEKSLFIKLINYERNKELLADCPYIPFFDLAISFRYLVQRDGAGIASGMVRNCDMEKWNINTEQLYKMAKENTLRLFPPRLSRLDVMLKESVPDMPEVPAESSLYVLTNNQGVNGASYMIYKDIIGGFAEKLGSSLYIIPSSIHEILILPAASGMKKTELLEMVKEVNQYAVSELDYLSDNVYFYDINDENIKI